MSKYDFIESKEEKEKRLAKIERDFNGVIILMTISFILIGILDCIAYYTVISKYNEIGAIIYQWELIIINVVIILFLSRLFITDIVSFISKTMIMLLTIGFVFGGFFINEHMENNNSFTCDMSEQWCRDL